MRVTAQDLIDLLPIAAHRVNWGALGPHAFGKPSVCPVCALADEILGVKQTGRGYRYDVAADAIGVPRRAAHSVAKAADGDPRSRLRRPLVQMLEACQ